MRRDRHSVPRPTSESHIKVGMADRAGYLEAGKETLFSLLLMSWEKGCKADLSIQNQEAEGGTE